MQKGLEFSELLKKLKKEELINIIKDYNFLANIYNDVTWDNFKVKKDLLIKEIEEVKNNYLKYFSMSLDNNDFEILKVLINKKIKNEYLNENKEFINYLIEKKIIWKLDELVIPKDIYKIIKSLLKNKEVNKERKINNILYNLVNGIIIAYGLIDIDYFKTIINDNGKYLDKLNYYYKKDYKIDNKMIVSLKLNSKKRINSYYKNKDYKKYLLKDFYSLGSNTYHHNIKSYKKFMRVLKRYYVFKNEDISFIDLNIVIPFLYNSINEEKEAKENLENTITELFEFKSDKLKEKMLVNIMNIRDEFPLWEYRGYTKKEKNI